VLFNQQNLKMGKSKVQLKKDQQKKDAKAGVTAADKDPRWGKKVREKSEGKKWGKKVREKKSQLVFTITAVDTNRIILRIL
jgi:hypothetical protein